MICFKTVCMDMFWLIFIYQITINLHKYRHIIHKSISNTQIKIIYLFSFRSRWSKNYLGHIAWRPPSTGSDAPVMYDESSEARKAIALATSSGCPGRPSACVSLDRSKNCRKKKKFWLKKTSTSICKSIIRSDTKYAYSLCYMYIMQN